MEGCDNEPLVAVTVTAYVPTVGEETVSVDDAEPPEKRLTLVGFREAARPEGETDVDREIVPEKLLKLDKLIVDVPEEPD